MEHFVRSNYLFCDFKRYYAHLVQHNIITLRSLLFAGTNFSGFHDSLI